jgi:iron complex transport system substrate-binding protein
VYPTLLFVFAFLTVLCSACKLTQTPDPRPMARVQVKDALAANIRDGCVANYDPAIDYFPEKLAFRHSVQLSVSYHKHYKVVTFKPSVATQEELRYALVQCGTPTPAGFRANQIVTVPVPTFATMNQSMGSTIALFGLTDRLTGISSIRAYTVPEILQRHKEGKVHELGGGTHSNIENTLAVRPDLYFTFYSAYPQYNLHPKLWEVGIKAVPFSDHTETTPLGHAEWIKYLALFFNAEGRAANRFVEIEQAYRQLAQRTRAVKVRPEVMVGATQNKDQWHLNGGRNYLAGLIFDAGGKYFWHRDQIAGSLVYASFEQVFDESAEVVMWTPPTFSGKSLGALIGLDGRLAHFRPVKEKNVQGWVGGSSIPWRYPSGDQSLDKPHVLLADLMSVLHPELLPQHERVYLAPLEP